MDKKCAFLSKTRIFLSDPKLLNGSVYFAQIYVLYFSVCTLVYFVPGISLFNRKSKNIAGVWNLTRVCSDASSAEMQCLKPLRHSGATFKRRQTADLTFLDPASRRLGLLRMCRILYFAHFLCAFHRESL